MGGDIAALCAMRGLTVTLQDTAPERIAPAVKRAAQLFQRRLRDPRRVRDALDRLIPDVGGAGAARADVIIEAIFENLEAKRSLFAKLEWQRSPTRSWRPTPRASSSPTSPPRCRILRGWWEFIFSTRFLSCSWWKSCPGRTQTLITPAKPQLSCARSTSCRCQ